MRGTVRNCDHDSAVVRVLFWLLVRFLTPDRDVFRNFVNCWWPMPQSQHCMMSWEPWSNLARSAAHCVDLDVLALENCRKIRKLCGPCTGTRLVQMCLF